MRIATTIFLIVIGTFLFSQGTNNDCLVQFSHVSGFHSSSFQLKLETPDSSEIKFSLDGSYPSIKYKEALDISETTTIRVKNEGRLNGKVRNFIFLGRKPTLPVVSITMKAEDLFDEEKGIYVKGKNASKTPPYKGANYHKNWERVAYVEFIDTNDEVGFNQKIGIKIFGGFSSMLPQKSFSLHARKKYGNKRIKFPMFPDRKFKKYKSLVLRNSGSDFCSTHMRDVMMTSLVRDFDLDVQSYRPCIVYLNGEYWGIYHIREKINEHFIEQHYGVDKDSVAILKHRYDVQHYGRINYKNVLKFIKKTDFSDNENIRKLSELIDINNYLDYNIAQVYFNNIDAGGNIRYWRYRNKNGKWRWILFDTDFGFALRKGNGAEENTLKKFTTYSSEAWPSPAWSTLIIRKLLENDSIRDCYIRKMSYYLNTTFDPSNVNFHIDTIAQKLSAEIPYHFDRWQRKPEKWRRDMALIYDFADLRKERMFSFMKEKFEFDTAFKAIINFSINGDVYLDSYKIDSGFNGTFLFPREYKMRAEPKFGYQFARWSGGIVSNESEVLLSLTQNDTIEAVFERKGISKFQDKIILNEIANKDSIYSDYIELYNTSNEEVNLSSWVIINNGIKRLTFPEGTKLMKGEYLLLVKDSLPEQNNQTKTIFGLFNITKNSRIELYSNDEELVDEVKLTKKMFKGKSKIEKVNSIIKNGWVPSGVSSFGEMNEEQKKLDEEIKWLFIGLASLLFLIVIIFIIYSFVKRIKRLRGATE